ncbi:hypothetical protein J6W91_01705 [Candidatus Saccharibacteria bacterium]|nr:hypothetical protein [Candidatus Saccharibacteria bacterium]
MDKEGQQVPEEPIAEKEAPKEEKPINESLSAEMDALLGNNEQTQTQEPATTPEASIPVIQPATTPTAAPVETETVIPETPQSQPQAPEKKKVRWPLITSWIAFIASLIVFLAFGPGSIYMAIKTSPFAWLVSYWYIPMLIFYTKFIAPVIFILFTLSIFSVSKKRPSLIKIISIHIISSAVGFIFLLLAYKGIIKIKIITMAIIFGIIIVASILAIIILRKKELKKPKVPLIISTVLSILGVIISIILLSAGPIKDIIMSNIAEQNYNSQVENASEKSGLSNHTDDSSDLAEMVYLICSEKDYNIVYQNDPDTGLFECTDNTEVYSVTDPHAEKSGYMKTASASFIGATYDEAVEQFFPGVKYVYQNYLNADIDPTLILLIEANSEQEALGKIVEPLYKYITKINEKYVEDVRVAVFYTESLNTVKTTRDVIVMAGATGIADWMPHGNGFGDYMFTPDDTASLREILATPSLYSTDTRNALKFHRHIEYTFRNVKSNISSSSQIYTILNNYWENGL